MPKFMMVYEGEATDISDMSPEQVPGPGTAAR